MPRRTDFLIIGSGIAGLRAAADLALAGDVLVLTKAAPAESNTGYAQGGIAAAVGADDSPALHAADTIAAGDGLCNEDAVRVLVDGGVRYVRELIDWGARFDRDTTTGALTPLAGTAGCVSETGTAGACADGRALDGAVMVTVSPAEFTSAS